MQHGRSYHIIDRPDKTEVRKGKISHDRAVLHISYEVSTWVKKSLHLDNMKLEMRCRGEEEHRHYYSNQSSIPTPRPDHALPNQA